MSSSEEVCWLALGRLHLGICQSWSPWQLSCEVGTAPALVRWSAERRGEGGGCSRTVTDIESAVIVEVEKQQSEQTLGTRIISAVLCHRIIWGIHSAYTTKTLAHQRPTNLVSHPRTIAHLPNMNPLDDNDGGCHLENPIVS